MPQQPPQTTPKTLTPLSIGDRFMLSAKGQPRGHVWTVEAIRPSRGSWEGDGAVFDCSEVSRTGMKMEWTYSLADSILFDYAKRGLLHKAKAAMKEAA